MKKIVFGVLGLIAFLGVISYTSAHGLSDFNRDNVELHRQHHIEMHGDDKDFEEMHETCEAMHENNIDDMKAHHRMMHGGDYNE